MKEFGEKLPNTHYLHRIGSYAVIIESERVAVVPSDELGGFMLIGGGLENGESEIEALHREAIEEIGYKISIGEKIGTATEYFYAQIDQKYFAKECHFYRAGLAEKVSEQSENELIWLPKERHDEIYHQSHRRMVEQELNFRQS
jgi:8-oxo-dGTP diphosphatase